MILQLLRAHQWYKNLVIFLALFYTCNLFNLPLLTNAILGFIALCLMSSSYYITNDVNDREEDRKHPEKKNRPIASGKVNVATAASISLILYVVSLYLSFLISPAFMVCVFMLFLSSSAYTLWLRNVAFVDIHMIALNFVIRAVAGAVVINMTPSPWLIATVFFMALLLALAKRRGELIILGSINTIERKVFRVYDLNLLDNLLLITTSVLLLTYTLYTFAHSSLLMLTVPLASIAIMRYLYLIKESALIARKPEYLITDKLLVRVALLWVISSYAILSLS